MYVSHQLSIADRRRGWTISIIIHALLLLLCFLPFMIQDLQEEDLSQAIAIRFERPYFDDSSTKQSGSESEAASAESETASETQTPREQLAVVTVSSIQPAATMPVPSRSITMTQATPEVVLPPTRTNSPKADKFFEQPLEVTERIEVDRVEAFKEKPNPALQQQVTWHIADKESSDQGAPASFDFGNSQESGSGKNNTKGTSGNAPDGQGEDSGYDPFGDGSFPDGTGSGKGNAGKDTGTGQEGKGLYWGDFAGDGLFNRKVIKRAPIAQIADLPGKMVINLCVDQLGKVVFAKFDSPNSTIRSKVLSAKAEEYAKMYVFDEDPSAPREQCGRLTFIFEIKK